MGRGSPVGDDGGGRDSIVAKSKRTGFSLLGRSAYCPIATPCVLTTEVLQVFNAWLKDIGPREWSKEQFHPGSRTTMKPTRHHVEETTDHKAGQAVTSALGRQLMPLPKQCRRLPRRPLSHGE
jgi:hypothetical protein